MSHLFTGARHAAVYRKYRPTYPCEVFSTIIDYCKKGPGSFFHALDIGCGSGQSSFPLTNHFKKVTGIDPSETQVQEAQRVREERYRSQSNVNIEFKVGTAENLSDFASSSVDLITIAQTLHWVDVSILYPEAKRLLTKNGVLVAYGYGNVKLDSDEANDMIWEFYSDTLGPYWDGRRHHIDNHFTEFTFPFADFQRVDTLSISRDMSLADFLGYLTTWSAYQTYMRNHPDSSILTDLGSRLSDVYRVDSPEMAKVPVTWPVFMLFGRHR